MAEKKIKKQNERTSNQSTESNRILNRNIPNASDCIIRGESGEGKYVATNPIHPKVQLIISYNYSYKVFVVWNGAVHQQLHNHCGKRTLSMGATAEQVLRKELDLNDIQRVYKPIKQDGYTNCVELVVLVGRDALVDFCKSYEAYIFPDSSTIPDGKECLFAVPSEPIKRIGSKKHVENRLIREKENFTRLKRDSTFRERVIARWQGKCIVCGITEKHLLEAAHIESVQAGGSDELSNGYCLCANHHRMYDAAILDIDIDAGVFRCHSRAVEDSPWYIAAEQRGFKLYLPEKEEK